MLGFLDPLPLRPARVLVAGVSGAGKTTLARRLSQILDIPHTEIDALHHGPGWTTRESFVADVTEPVAQRTWVTEWQYPAARALLAERADLLIWLDLSFPLTLHRLTRRTLGRRLRQEVLWNGNVEGPLWHFFTTRDHVIRWAISTRHDHRHRIVALEAAGCPTIVRVRTPRELEQWIAGPLAEAAQLGPSQSPTS